MEKFAYLRYLQATNQCELVVTVNTTFENIALDEELHAVRRATDTVGSLIEHTKNKLIKIIKDKSNQGENDDTQYNIPVKIKRNTKRTKNVDPNIVLEAFIKESHDRTFVNIFDQDYKLLMNPPLIKNMYLPAILYATYSIQPVKFFGLYTDRISSKFIWYRSKDKKNWQKVGEGFDYTINEEDIDHYLKVVCIPLSFNNIEGPQAEAVSERTVQEFPELPSCPFEKRHEHTKDLLQEENFRFITYNTLANRYTEMSGDTFSYCPPEALAIDYRKQLILKELLGYNADIICLQEIDIREFKTYFRAKLMENDFHCKFDRKGNTLHEGLVCAVRKSRYKMLSCENLVLANALRTKKIFGPLYKVIKRNGELKDSFMKQSTSLQVIRLKCKELKKIIIIGNTHLYYHPSATAIRLIQTYMSLKYLEKVQLTALEEWKNFDVVVIFCGDLNSSPDGAIYDFISNGSLPSGNVFCLQISAKKEVDFKHDLNFISACGTPKYTNYTPDFKNCLDYIFIQKEKIGVKKIIPLPEEELEQFVGLPNEIYPSDHLALVADLHFK